MLNIRSSLLFLSSIIIALLLTSCGGGEENNSTQEDELHNNIKSGVFIDGVVEGLAYKTESGGGFTDEKGKFKYIEGEEIQFSIGDIVLGKAITKPTMTPLDILGEGEDQNSSSFINIIRLLQTLDFDSNLENGIQILEESHLLSSGIVIPLDVELEQFEANQTLLNYIQTATGKTELVPHSDALAHWEETYNRNMFFHAKTGEPSYPVAFIAYDGSKVIPTYNLEGAHTGAIIETLNGDQIIIELYSDGTPKSIIVGDTYFIFSDYTENTVNLGVIFGDGSVEVLPGIMNYFSDLNQIIATSSKQDHGIARKDEIPTPVNVDLRKNDAILSSFVNSIASEQLANLDVQGVLLKGDEFKKILKDGLNGAIAKEVVLQAASQVEFIDIETLRAGGTVADIVIGAIQCNAGEIVSCYDVILTSTQSTAEAAKLLIEIAEDQGRVEEMAKKLEEKGLLKGPTLKITPKIIGIRYEGDSIRYQVFTEWNSSASNVDNTPIKLLTLKINDKPVKTLSNYLDSGGTHKFTITGTDNFGLSSTIDVNLKIPNRPTVLENESLVIRPPSMEVTSELTAESSLPTTFKIISAPKKALPLNMSLDANTGEFTYSANPIMFGSDTFTYIAEHLLKDNCIKTTTFDCIIPSLVGRINVEILRPEQVINFGEEGGVVQGTPYEFGVIELNKSSNEKTFIINNKGNADLVIESIISSDPGFSLTGIGNDRKIIGLNESASFSIIFSPKEKGDYSSVISIKSNDPYQSVINLYVTGIGVAEPSLIVKIGTQEVLILNSQDFREELVDLSSEPITLVLENNGMDSLIIDNILINDSSLINVFQLQDKNFPLTIQPEMNETIQVSFNPLDTVLYQASFQINSNDLNKQQFPLNFVGTGVQPQIKITSPEENASISWGFTSYAGSNHNTFINSTEFYIDDTLINTDISEPFSADLDIYTLSLGLHSIKVKATDKANNKSEDSRSFTVIDTILPSIEITNPTNNAEVSGTISIDVNATDDREIQSVELYVDGALIDTDTSEPYSVSYDTLQLTEGVHSIKAVAADTAGNLAENVITITLTDQVPPTVSIISPVNNTEVIGTISILVDATDNAAVESVELYIDDTFIGSDTSEPYSVSYDTLSVTEGIHSIKAVAVDTAGNLAEDVITITVLTDQTAPIVSLNSPTNNEEVSGTISILVDATDNAAVESVQFYIDDTLIGTDTSEPYSISYNTLSITEGSHTIKAMATDAAGNSSEDIISINIVHPPIYSYSGILELIGSYTEGNACQIKITGDVSVELSATDTTSGELSFIGREYVTWCDGNKSDVAQSFTFPITIIDGVVNSIYSYTYSGGWFITETATGTFNGTILNISFERSWDLNGQFSHKVTGSSSLIKQ
jgi:hypothetical protein